MFWFSYNYRIVFSISVNNDIGVLMEGCVESAEHITLSHIIMVLICEYRDVFHFSKKSILKCF